MEYDESLVETFAKAYLASDFLNPRSAKKRPIQSSGDLEKDLSEQGISLHDYEKKAPQNTFCRATRSMVALVYGTVIPWFSIPSMVRDALLIGEELISRQINWLSFQLNEAEKQKSVNRLSKRVDSLFKDFKTLPICLISPVLGLHCAFSSHEKKMEFFSAVLPLSEKIEKSEYLRHHFGIVNMERQWIELKERDIFHFPLTYQDLVKSDFEGKQSTYPSLDKLVRELENTHPNYSRIDFNDKCKEKYIEKIKKTLFYKEYKKLYIRYFDILSKMEKSQNFSNFCYNRHAEKKDLQAAIELFKKQALEDPNFAKRHEKELKQLDSIEEKAIKLREFFAKNSEEELRVKYYQTETRLIFVSYGAYGTYVPKRVKVPYFEIFTMFSNPQYYVQKEIEKDPLFERRKEISALKKIPQNSFSCNKDYKNYLFALDAISSGKSLLEARARTADEEDEIDAKKLYDSLVYSLKRHPLDMHQEKADKILAFIEKERKLFINSLN